MRGMIGTLFLSSIFPGRAPSGYVTLLSFVGGMYAQRHASLPREGLLEVVRSELARLLGVRGQPVVESVQHWPQAIPHFPVGYQATLDAVTAAERENEGLAIAGSFRGGPGTGDTLIAAQDAARRLLGVSRAQA
jgi:oxygen-dependent protoporphyrinogen oxidase